MYSTSLISAERGHLMPGTDPSAARAAARYGYDGEVSVATAGLVLSIG